MKSFFCLTKFFVHWGRQFIISLILFLLTGFLINANAAIKNSAASGNWNNPSGWLPTGVPGINDDVIIQTNHIITIDNHADVNSITVNPNGELKFLAGKILTLHGTLTVNGKMSMTGGDIHFGSQPFNLGPNSTFIWEPADNTSAGASLFINGMEHFDPASTLIIKKWYDYSSVPLGSVVTGDFGNLTLNSLSNGFLYEWNQNNQFETHKISGTLTIDQGWIVLDKSGSISNTTIGNINLATPNSYLYFHSGTHTGSFIVNTTTINNTGGELTGIYNGNGNVALNVSQNFSNLGNCTMIYNTGVFGVGNGNCALNVAGDYIQSTGDFRAIFNLTTTNAGTSNLAFTNINLSGGIMMGHYACHTSSATCNFKVNGNLNINFAKATDKFRVIGLTSLSGTYNNAKSTLSINGNLLLAGNAASEFTSSGSVGTETILIGGKVNINGCTGNFNMGSHQLTMNVNGDVEITGGTTSLSKSPGEGIVKIGGNFIQTAGIISIKGHTGIANITVEGNFSLANGTIFLHSNTNSPSPDPVNLTINGNFTHTGGTINYDDNSSDNSVSTIFIKSSIYTLSGNGLITRTGCGTNPAPGNLIFSKPGTISFQRNTSSHSIQVKQIISTGCTLDIVSGNLQVSSYTQASPDQLKISSGGILRMNSSKIISNTIFPYSGITVDNNGRLTLSHTNGLYNGTDNACISSAGNMNFFLAPNSIVEYNGKSSQVLTGTGTGLASSNNHKYGKLEVNFQGSPVENVYLQSSTVFIRTSLILTKGELKLNNYSLTIESGTPAAISRQSGYIKSETNESYNQSFLKWMNVANGTYIFPFGVSSTEYIPFAFTPLSGTGSVAIATRATGADNLPYPNGGSIPPVSVIKRNGIDISKSSVIDRWYDIAATGFKANVTLSYRGIENTTADSLTDATFSIQAWDGLNWSRSMGSAIAVKNGIGTISANNVSSFSHWMVSTTTSETNTADILNFDAVLKNNEVEASWSVNSSNNSGYFFIERSTNQVNFSEAGKTNAIPGSGETALYTYSDSSPVKGVSYYRLKHINDAGRITYSDYVLINNKEEIWNDFSILSIVPNPFHDYFKVSFISPGDNTTEFVVTTSGGQTVKAESIRTVKGINNYNFSEKQNLLPGIYVLTVRNGSNVVSKKIFKS